MGSSGRVFNPYAGMRFEATVEDCLVVEGEVPEELNGGFYRNGPQWRRPTKQGHLGLYSLDGMIQGLVFREGRTEFRNRWVRTPKYLAEERAGRGLFEWSDGDFGDYRCWGLGEVVRDEHTTGVPQGTNFVNVFPFAGELLASGEQGSPPVALDPVTLDTRGVVPWSTRLSRGMVEPACYGDAAFTAHPKWDPRTGTLYGWNYRDEAPFVTLHWVAPDGAVQTRDLWDAPYGSTVHDMWLTEHYVAMPFQPFVMTRARIAKGLSVFGWDPELPIVIALIPRDDIDGEIRWITADIEPEYVMHTLSANHIGDTIVLDAPIADRPPFPFEDMFEIGEPNRPYWGQSLPVLGRWTVDLTTGTATSERLGDMQSEFPKVDERFYGCGYEWAFLLAGHEPGHKIDTLVQRNVRTGAERSHRIDGGATRGIAEPTFAPRAAGSPEGDGYLIVPVSDPAENTGQFQIFDTDDIEQGPIARIELPFKFGWTAHGHWMNFDATTR